MIFAQLLRCPRLAHRQPAVGHAVTPSVPAGPARPVRSEGKLFPLAAVPLVLLALLALFAAPAARAQNTAATATVLHTFDANGADGVLPSLCLGTDGNFYGAAGYGGTNDSGTIFRVTPTGNFTVLYNFTGGDDGANPLGRLCQGRDGNFYGTTTAGGTGQSGTVFKVAPTGTLTTLHGFTGGADGSYAQATLVLGTDGNFYGTTAGGDRGGGTIFRVTPDGTLTTLYSFAGMDSAAVASDGNGPVAGLVQASDGNFYGPTLGGGVNDSGTIFRVTPDGVLTTIYSFPAPPGGGTVGAVNPLLQGADGNLYGTALYASFDASGIVYKISLAGAFTTLAALEDFEDIGDNPTGPLLQGADGNFYGTLQYGGLTPDFARGYGSVIQITPAGVITALHTFSRVDDLPGNGPEGGVLQTSAGFYGATRYGTGNFGGAIFRLSLPGGGGGGTTPTGPVPVIADVGTKVLKLGVAFSYQIVATNQPTSYAADNLPPGLNVDTASGLISGTPTAEGNFLVDVSATNANGTGSNTVFVTVTGTPVVTLKAFYRKVTVGSGVVDQIYVILSEPTAQKLRVHYSIKGSAINGVDYELLSGNQKLKAYKLNKPIKLLPQGDLGGVSKKTVVLTLLPGDGYVVGTPGKVKVKITAAP